MIRSRSAKLLLGLSIAAAVVLTPTLAFAATPTFDPAAATPATQDGFALNMLWIVIGGCLVIFMQLGFAMVETGFCRSKNAAHVASTNLAIFGLGVVGYFLIGFPMMFGGYSYPGYFGMDKPLGSALIGSGSWVFLWKGPIALTHIPAKELAPVMAFFFYMVAFMDTTATIPTGGMAERWKFKSFMLWGLFAGAVYYPLFGAWTWGGGWLSQLGNSLHLGFGYVDFAGSGVVHLMGGVASLAGIMVLGPRIGKYGKDGKARAIPGHNIPMAIFGAIVLLFGWFGFNAASTFAATDVRFTAVAVNTAVASAFGLVAALVWVIQRTGKPDPGMIANGLLAGLVAVTAPCAFIDPWAAALIGTIAGFIVVEGVFFVERRKIDDPVGSIAVHGMCGLFGVLAVGLFANGQYGAGWNLTKGKLTDGHGVTGIFGGNFSLGIRQLGAQAIGALVICTVMFGLAYGFFKLQDKLTKGGIRSSIEDEIAGIDYPEMGVEAYPKDMSFSAQDVVASQLPKSHQAELSDMS